MKLLIHSLRLGNHFLQIATSGPGKKIVTSVNSFFDQVQSPVRIEAINPDSVLQEWEMYASLRIQKKPVDPIYFPHGTHIHQKPLERLESQQGSVDWFRFWLQGYEDPDPGKQTQYERWRLLQHTSPTVQPTGPRP